ncbi:MAG TPA: ATP-binding protein [Candidatus Limnocylindrales bacterium]|nr:ATP-binding protein [Candidatus Limnocylindrales bacterium]
MARTESPRFLSLRWRILILLALVGLAVALFTGLILGNAGPAVSDTARQITAVAVATATTALVLAAFLASAWIAMRVNRVRRVTASLVSGEMNARTGLRATDEIGALGAALDRYAEHVNDRQDGLRATQRKQRREIAHLSAVLNALPDGVVVQDSDGMVILMNERAKALLGSVDSRVHDDLRSMTAAVTDALGVALAPGMYALGDPRQVEVGGKMVSAQAIPLASMAGERVGTGILLRDITGEVRRERERDALLNRLSAEIEQPLAEKARAAASSALRASASPQSAGAMDSFAREMSRHTVALHNLIAEMRDLTTYGPEPPAQDQKPIALETLFWAVANEWRQKAVDAGLTLDVVIDRRGLFVLGDERRLRWAIGNLVDNAIRYTLPGGKVTMEIRAEDEGMARMRVRDTGVGISRADQPYVFTRFFRGAPVTEDGVPLRVPGTGQGLTVARQILQAHGGEIRLKSKPFVGTAVYFALPVTAAEGLSLKRSDEQTGQNTHLRIEHDDSHEAEERAQD